MTSELNFAKAFADETRQQIMQLLCCRWLCVGDIVDEVDGVSQPTVSHHLAVLREANLVHLRREGKQVFYTLNQDEVVSCCGLLMRHFAPERATRGERLPVINGDPAGG
jgi:ArsR family transcriptional regulator, arsenate/arsenite/antimonite-responsive transcriptional repressor